VSFVTRKGESVFGSSSFKLSCCFGDFEAISSLKSGLQNVFGHKNQFW